MTDFGTNLFGELVLRRTALFNGPDVRRSLSRDWGSGPRALVIGCNPAYLQQFVTRGMPKTLDEGDRFMLAQFFGCDERRLGARDPWTPETSRLAPRRR